MNAIVFQDFDAVCETLRTMLQKEVLAYTFVNTRATYRDIIHDVSTATGEREVTVRSALNSLMRKGYVVRSGRPSPQDDACIDSCSMQCCILSDSISAPPKRPSRIRNALYQNNLVVGNLDSIDSHPSVQRYRAKGRTDTSELDFTPKTKVEAIKALWTARGFIASLVPYYERTSPAVAESCFEFLRVLRSIVAEDLEQDRLEF